MNRTAGRRHASAPAYPWYWHSLLILLLVSAPIGCVKSPPASQSKGQVVLLHGLGRSDLSMVRIKAALADSGYNVIAVSYPSTQHSIEYLADRELGPALKRCCSDPDVPLHFVTHSMGGIILRFYLENHELDNLGRVVMLSPPNQGSELADWMSESPVLERLLGPWAEQLGTSPQSVPQRLGPVDFEVGIIAGDRTLNPLFSRVIPGVDDGKVAVERTKVEGMADFLVVPHTHTYIMMKDDVIAQVIHFIEHGDFYRDSTHVTVGGEAVDE